MGGGYMYYDGFIISWYGGECYVDCICPIDTINPTKVVDSLRYKNKLETIILSDSKLRVIAEYHVIEDCFSFIPKNSKERKLAYDVRNIYKRYKKTKPTNCSDCKNV